MLYENIALKQDIGIQRIYTIHYYEYDRLFAFEGESHPFWELVYVDLGEAHIASGDNSFTLTRGQAALHAPDVFHALQAAGGEPLSLIVLSFECASKAIGSLCGQVIDVENAEKHLLSRIIADARDAFESPLGGSYFKLRRRAGAHYGAEQMIRLNMEMLFLLLVRKRAETTAARGIQPAVHKRNDNEALVDRAIALMRLNMRPQLSLAALCRELGVSKDKLQRVFRDSLDTSVMDHYIALRVETAKALMRDNCFNFTQIAEQLGFSSIHYFSKQFKGVTGITPTEYCQSVRSLSEKKSC